MTRINATTGPPFAAELSIPDRFAVTWASILGHSRREVASSDLLMEVRRFMDIPANRKVTDSQNKDLLAEIVQEDAEWAIKSIDRRKAAGQDGIGNDFYKDFSSVLVGPLTRMFNDILLGGKPPLSFLKAVVIPLRKKEIQAML